MVKNMLKLFFISDCLENVLYSHNKSLFSKTALLSNTLLMDSHCDIVNEINSKFSAYESAKMNNTKNNLQKIYKYIMYFSLCRKGTKMKTENSTTSKTFHSYFRFFFLQPITFLSPNHYPFWSQAKEKYIQFSVFCPFYLFCYIFALFNKTCAIIIISFQCEWNFHAFFIQLFHFHCFSLNECLVSIFIMDFQIFSIILMVHSVYREITIKLQPF